MSSYEERIRNVRRGLSAYKLPNDFESEEERLTDLMTDLLHLARSLELNTTDLLARVENHYNWENIDEKH